MQESREYVGAEGQPGGATESWEFQERRAADAVPEVGRRARQIRDEVSQTLRGTKEKLGVAYDRTADQAARAYRGTREYAQANPGMAAAVTFAAGVGAGMMVASRNGARAYRRGLVPVVAIALARAVIDVLDGAR